MYSQMIQELERDLEILQKQREQYIMSDVMHLANGKKLYPLRIIDEQIEDVTERLYDLKRFQREAEQFHRNDC